MQGQIDALSGLIKKTEQGDRVSAQDEEKKEDDDSREVAENTETDIKNRDAETSPFPKLLHLQISKELFIISTEGNGDFGCPHYPRRKLDEL